MASLKQSGDDVAGSVGPAANAIKDVGDKADTAAGGVDTFHTGVKNIGTSADGVGDKVGKIATDTENAGKASSQAATSTGSFGSSLAGLGGSFASVSGGAFGLWQNMTALDKAHLAAERSANALTKAQAALETAQGKVNTLIAQGKQDTPEYAKAVAEVEAKQKAVQLATDKAAITQDVYNRKNTDFLVNIGPSLLSTIGGIVTAFGSMPSAFSAVTSAFSGLGSKFSSVLSVLPAMLGGLGSAFASLGASMIAFIMTPAGMIITAIGALATLITLIATNTFGLRDAFMSFGKAITDFLMPIIRPLMDAFNAIKDAFGGFFDMMAKGLAGVGKWFSDVGKGIGDWWGSITGGKKEAEAEMGKPIPVPAVAPTAAPAAKAPSAAMAAVPGATPELIADYTKKINEESSAVEQAANKNRVYAAIKGIDIPAGVNRSNVAVNAFVDAMKKEGDQQLANYGTAAAYLQQTGRLEEAKNLDVAATIKQYEYYKRYDDAVKAVTTSNESLRTELDAMTSVMATNEGQQALMTAGTLKQEKTLQDLQKAHIEAQGSLAEYQKQLDSGQMQMAQFNAGVDEQIKKQLDAEAAIAKANGTIAEYSSQIASGRAIVTAYNAGIQETQKGMLDAAVAIAKTQGAQDELDRALAEGTPQVLAYMDGWQKARGEMQSMITDTENLRGQVDYMTESISSGQALIENYANGIQRGALAYTEFIAGAANARGEQETYNAALEAGVSSMTTWPPMLEKTTKNMELMQKALLGVPDALEGIRDAGVKFFEPLSKAADDMLKDVVKAFDDFSKAVKDPLESIPKYIRDALSPETLKGIEMKGAGEALAKQFTGPFAEVLNREGPAAAAQFLEKAKAAFANPEYAKMLDPVINALKSGSADAVQAAIIEFQKLGKGTGDMASQLNEQFGTTFSNLPKFVAAGTAGIPGQMGEVGTQSGDQFGAGLATADLSQLFFLAKSTFEAIKAMAAGSGTAISQELTKGLDNAAGMYTMLQSHAQAAMNALARMPAGVATAMTSAFNTGTQNAAGSLNNLQSHAQAMMNSMAAMPKGVATAMTSGFNTGANNAAGALNNLQSRAQSVMNAVVSATNTAIAAIQRLASAIAALPDKTVKITADTSQAESAVRALQNSINSLQGKNITNTVTTQYRTVGSPAVAAQAGHHGIVNSPTMFLAGEAGPELVDITPIHPAAAANQVIKNAGAQTTGAGGPTPKPNVTVVVNVAGKEVWREIREAIFSDIGQF